MMSKSSRRWWIGGGLLLIGVVTALLWSRPIRIPLKDGTTLTIAAITVGTEHSRPESFTWRRLLTQISRRTWGWPTRFIGTPQPFTVLWFDDPKMLEKRRLVLVDRHGWRWNSETEMQAVGASEAYYLPIETDGTARVEVWDQEELVGASVIPLKTAVPVATPMPILTVPPIATKPGKPAPFPIRRADGPLVATLRSVAVRIVEGNRSLSEGGLQLETRWNDQPFPPEISLAAVTDPFGRRSILPLKPGQPFQVPLPPHSAWDMHLQILRGRAVLHDPDSVVLVKPDIAEGAAFFRQEGSTHGAAWRVTVVPPGSLSLPARFGTASLSLPENVPLVVVEIDPQHLMGVRIEPLDRDGRLLPATPLLLRTNVPNIHAFRSPGFDAGQGHTLRIGFDEPRLVQFTFHPAVVPASRSESPARE